MTADEFRSQHTKWRSANSLTKAIVKYLTVHGHFAWRQNNIPVPLPDGKGYRSGSVYPGIADILGCTREGRALAIEVKVGKDTASEEQIRFIENFTARGGVAFVARSLDDVIKNLGKPKA